jgi:hypothetical protein
MGVHGCTENGLDLLRAGVSAVYGEVWCGVCRYMAVQVDRVIDR